jgi:hypothetical protein
METYNVEEHWLNTKPAMLEAAKESLSNRKHG